MKQRSVGLAIILTLVTCGLYGIYWMYALTEEVSRLSDEPNFTGGKALILTLITCGIYQLFWSYELGKNVTKAQLNKGKVVSDNGVLFLVLSIFGLGIIGYAIAQSEVNKLV